MPSNYQNSLENNNNNKYNNNIQNSKEKNIPIPTYNKLNILNKMTDSKRDMKNKINDEVNNKQFLYNKFKYNNINEFNQTNNDDTNQTLLSIENRLNTFSNNNTKSIDDEKMIFHFNEKRYDNNKNVNIKNRKTVNECINKINSFKIDSKKKNNDNLKNKNKNNCNYIISSHEVNEDYSKIGKDNGNDINDDFDEQSDLSIQSLSDSKVLEIANTYVDDQIDKNKVSDILTYKRKKNQNSYYEK